MVNKELYAHYCSECNRLTSFLYKTITGDVLYYCKYCMKTIKINDGDSDV